MPLLDRRSILTGAAALSVYASVRSPFAFAQATSGPFKHEPLPYAPDKNEPHIDKMTMEIHHGRHHAAYVHKLNNAAKENPMLGEKPLHELLANLNSVPEAIRTTVRNNGGGHANHVMFWQVMGGSGGKPSGAVADAISGSLGGLEKLQSDFNAAGGRVFGSGWVFVTVDKSGKLALVTKPNQDTPIMDGQMVLFGNDVWEPQVPEPPGRLSQGVVERRELGRSQQALRHGEGRQADDLIRLNAGMLTLISHGRA
jgi:Fe-Mn family superoxide dismutase